MCIRHYVNVVGVSPSGGEKACHLSLHCLQPVSLYRFFKKGTRECHVSRRAWSDRTFISDKKGSASVLSIMAASGRLWLSSNQNVASETEKLNFQC